MIDSDRIHGYFLTKDKIKNSVGAHPRTMIFRDDLRRAAVLVPMVLIGNEWHLLLTKRTDGLEHHRGQVSFPGGAIEKDEQPEEAALREAFEEIALKPEWVETIAFLDDLWTPSGYVITPVLGIVSLIEDIRPNPIEVSKIFTVPLLFFSDERNAVKKLFTQDDYSIEVYYYEYDSELIWGATAFIIRDLLRRLSLL